MLWQLMLYRRDSQTPVIYNDVKHVWWEEKDRLVIAQNYSKEIDGFVVHDHHYIVWMKELISHYVLERAKAR